jgi:hypothetical protein
MESFLLCDFVVHYIPMTELCEGCEDHLLAALQCDDPAEKNYHVRQVLQATAADIPDKGNIKLKPLNAD